MNRESPHRCSAASVSGFTLMEMMTVMLVLTLLLGAVFGVVRGTLELSDEMTMEQAADARLQGFIQFCDQTFRHLPAGAVVRHRVRQSGNHYLGQLAILGGASVFPGAGPEDSEALILQSEEQSDGYVEVVLRSLSQDELVDWEKGDRKAGRVLSLLKNVSLIEWRFFNFRSGQWETPWNDLLPLTSGQPAAAEDPEDLASPAAAPRKDLPPAIAGGRRAPALRPGLVELRLGLAADSVQRWVFWTPPARMP